MSLPWEQFTVHDCRLNLYLAKKKPYGNMIQKCQLRTKVPLQQTEKSGKLCCGQEN